MEVEEEVVREEEVEQEEAEGTEEEDVGYKEVNVSVVSHDQDGTQIIHLSAEDVMDDSTASPSMSNPRLKQKQYAQRYRREWERLDYCKGWLKPHPTNEILGYCKACDRTLHARRNDLRKHALCSKHKKNMELLKAGTPIRRRVSMNCKYPPALLHDQELKGWCVEMPLQRNRVWCRQCRCSLVAQTKALKQHAKSRKHLSNLNERPESPPQPDDQYDDQYHEVDLNYDDAGPSSAGGYESPMPRGGDRAASPLVESDFAGRVTYSIGLGNRKVGFLGAGQIAQAIAQGMLEQGLLLPHDVIVSAPSQRNMLQWKRWKCATTNNNDDVVREADIVFVAVKASVLVRLIGRLTPVSDGKTRLFISLVSGVTRERMTALLSCRVLPIEKMSDDSQPEVEVTGPPLHVIRCAPNKMMSISSGFCAYCMGDDVPHSLYLVVETMFSALGTCVQVEEHLMDAYSTMIASGAAFTCAFIEAMVQGGVSLDMGWDEALKVASAVVSGTSKLLMRTSLDPSKLRKSISTPGGSTIIGLAALQRGGLDDAVGKALQLACEKTREVGEAVCGGGSGGGNSSIAGAGDTSSASITG